MSIVITYFSGAGHTRILAGHIAAGAERAAGRPAVLIDVADLSRKDWQILDAAGAIVFGSPTYMGGVSAEVKAFMDATSDLWEEQRWRDKIAAGFTVAAYPSGDKLATLIQMAVFAAQHAMIWVSFDEIGAPVDKAKPGINRDGSSLGLMATSSRDKTIMIDDYDAETARRFGARVAQATRRWSGRASG